jgi:hypothetical protein
VHKQDKIEFAPNLPMLAMHLACGLAWWTGVSVWALMACALLYLVRMFGLTAGYHRYFSHGSYKTGRLFQFALAWLGCSAAQKGPLWWAGNHPCTTHTPIPKKTRIHQSGAVSGGRIWVGFSHRALRPEPGGFRIESESMSATLRTSICRPGPWTWSCSPAA